MTPKEYLSQGYRLEQDIKLLVREIESLRAAAATISSPGFEQHYNPNHATEAPFEKVMMEIEEMEKEQAEKLMALIRFKKEITDVINAVEEKDLRLVLHYRYICNWTWTRIGEELGWDEKTIRRWHNKALSKVRIPENPTVIERGQKVLRKWS